MHSLISHEGLDFGWKDNSQGGVFFSAMSHPRVKCKPLQISLPRSRVVNEASQRLAASGFPKKKKTRFKGRKCTLPAIYIIFPFLQKPHGLKFLLYHL